MHRDRDGSLKEVAARGFVDMAVDGRRILALGNEGAVTSFDRETGGVLQTRSVGPTYLGEGARLAPAPRAVWVTAQVEGTVIRLAR